MQSGTKQRIIVGLLTTLFSLALIIGSHIPVIHFLFGVVIFGLIWISFNEYEVIAELKGVSLSKKTALLLSFLYIVALTIWPLPIEAPFLPLGFLFLSLLILFGVQFKRGVTPLLTLATTFFGLFYIAFPLASLYQINYLFPETGPFWLLYLVIVVKLSDTVAYFVGSKVGRKKLAPYISPKKTYEGAIGGIVGSLVGSVLFHFFAPGIVSFGESIILGLVLSILAMFGDLSESLLKRDASVKDSNQLPGLGGILDMMDSLLFATPALLFYLIL